MCHEAVIPSQTPPRYWHIERNVPIPPWNHVGAQLDIWQPEGKEENTNVFGKLKVNSQDGAELTDAHDMFAA
jgi:hypothetical protein